MRIFLKRKLPLNKALKILLITNSFTLLAGAMLGPIYALFVEEVGGDLLDASFAGGAYALAAGITVYLSGKYADKIRRDEIIIIVGYSIMGLGFLSYIIVDSIWLLLIAQVVVGLGEAVYSPAFDKLYSKHLDAHREATEWGSWESVYYFATAIGAVVGGVFATLFGFKILFVIMSALCFASALYIFRLPKRTF